MPEAGLGSQFALQIRKVMLLAVDGPFSSGLLNPIPPSARSEQTVEVYSRNARQAEQNCMRAEETADLPVERLIPKRVGERVEIIYVQFVGFRRAVGRPPEGYVSAVILGCPDQILQIPFAQDFPRRIKPDAVVRSQEIQKGRRAAGSRVPVHPIRKDARITGQESMQYQRRQREIVDQVRFVAAVSGVGDILRMRHIRLGGQPDARRGFLKHRAQQLDDKVGLRKVDAGRAGLLPQVSGGIQPEDRSAAGRVEEQQVRHLQQHPGF